MNTAQLASEVVRLRAKGSRTDWGLALATLEFDPPRITPIDDPRGLEATFEKCEAALLVDDHSPDTLRAECLCVERMRQPNRACEHILVLLAFVAEALSDGANEADPGELECFLTEPGRRSVEHQLAVLDDRLVGMLRPVTEASPDEEPCWVMRWHMSVVPMLASRRRKKNGDWSVPKATKGYGLEGFLSRSPYPADREVLNVFRDRLGVVDLTSLQQYAGNERYGGRVGAGSHHLVPLMLALTKHPAVINEDGRPAKIREAEVRLRLVEGGNVLRVDARFEGQVSPVLRFVHTTENGVVAQDPDASTALVSAVTDRGVRQALGPLLREAVEVDRAAAPQVVARLMPLSDRVTLELPGNLAGEELPYTPQWIVRVNPGATPLPTIAFGLRLWSGGPFLLPGDGGAHQTGTVGDRLVFVRRPLATERTTATNLAASLTLPVAAPGWSTSLPFEELLDLLARLEANVDKVQVEWAEGKKTTVFRKPAQFKVQVSRAADWFGVEGTADVEGAKLSLAALFAARREGRKYLQVAPGKWIELAKAASKALDQLDDVTHESHGKLKLSRTALASADTLFEELDAHVPLDWKALAERVRSAADVDSTLPAGLVATLRPYQHEGVLWLRRLAHLGLGGLLADDMGLGKTLQAIALLVDRAPLGPQLVVAPTSVAGNWIRELQKFAPGLRPIDFRLMNRDTVIKRVEPGDVVIVSYGLLRADLERFTARRFTTLVVDEAQAIKNWGTDSAKAVRAIEADWKLALTGTPVENHLGELYSLVESVCAGVFGPWEHFARRFAGPIEKNGDVEAKKKLARLIGPLVLRRTKAQVLTDLPPRTEVRLDVELGRTERALYDAARLEAVDALSGLVEQDEDGSRLHVLAALTRLRQLASCARTVEPSAPMPSAKMTLLGEQLAEVLDEGGSALVFSQFVRQLDLVSTYLDTLGIKHFRLAGDTPAAERQRLVEAFQRGEAKVFLVSLKAGGTGLNLTAADHVYLLDPWWNPAVEDQAADRAHRIGQTRPVTIHRLVARNTIEERVIALHEAKRGLAAAVLGEGDVAARLGTRELLQLLRSADADGEPVTKAKPKGPAKGK